MGEENNMGKSKRLTPYQRELKQQKKEYIIQDMSTLK
jgi:hypothetical protein